MFVFSSRHQNSGAKLLGNWLMCHTFCTFVLQLHPYDICNWLFIWYMQLIVPGTFMSSASTVSTFCPPNIWLLTWASISTSIEACSLFSSDPMFCFLVQCNPSPGHLHRRMTTRRTTCSWSSTMEIRLKWCSHRLNRRSLRARRLHQQL